MSKRSSSSKELESTFDTQVPTASHTDSRVIKEQSIDNHSEKSKKTVLLKEEDPKRRQLSKHRENSKTYSSRATTTGLVGSDELSIKRRKDLAKMLSGPSKDNVKSGENSVTTLLKGSVNSEEQKSVTSHSILSVLKDVNVELPNVKHDIRQTKLFLQKQGVLNLSIWTHLNNVLNKIIAEQPENVIDYFEEYSRKVKQERLLLQDTLRDIYVPLPQLESAKNQILLVNSFGIKEDAEEPVGGEEEEASESPKKLDLEEAAFYFHQAGIVIPDVQLFTLNIAMKKLSEDKNLIKPRFWGKIQGTKQDYFVLECELTEEEYEKRAEEDELAEAAEAERISAEKMAAEAMKEEAEAEEEAKLSKKSVDNVEDTEEKEVSIKSGEKIEDHIENESVTEESVTEAHEVRFDLPENEEAVEEEEMEDPLLPPLPPPKRLLKYKIPPLLKPVVKDIIKIPSEKIGQGINKKIYYVCNTPELEWAELPNVTPEQINVARQIKVYLTGDLESKIITYPAFPGTEKNFLRAQIARISAATQVSPLGFYKFGDGGEEEEEEEVAEEEESGEKGKYVENPNFQPIPLQDLIDPSFGSWVHHSQYILKQGRTEWWNAKKAAAGEEEAEEEQEEEEEEEGEEGGGGEEKEVGPALLTPLSEDSAIEGSPAWTARKTHNYNPDMAAVVIKSNFWPGAYAFAFQKKYENVYFGWGHKHYPLGFSPAQLPHPEYEYDLGPEIMEIQDPTVEVEETWRQAHKKKPPPAEGEEGEEGEEEEEEEDEDDD